MVEEKILPAPKKAFFWTRLRTLHSSYWPISHSEYWRALFTTVKEAASQVYLCNQSLIIQGITNKSLRKGRCHTCQLLLNNTLKCHIPSSLNKKIELKFPPFSVNPNLKCLSRLTSRTLSMMSKKKKKHLWQVLISTLCWSFIQANSYIIQHSSSFSSNISFLGLSLIWFYLTLGPMNMVS